MMTVEDETYFVTIAATIVVSNAAIPIAIPQRNVFAASGKWKNTNPTNWFANQTIATARRDWRSPTVPAKATASAANGVTQESARLALIAAMVRIVVQVRRARLVVSERSAVAGRRM